MGCHRCKASLASTAPLHHDQHLPDQPGPTAGATAPQQGPPGAHPRAASIPRPQQAAHSLSGRRGGPAFFPVRCRIHLSLQ